MTRPGAEKQKTVIGRPNLVDRMVATVSPARGLRRAQARAALPLYGYPGVEKAGGGKKGTLSNWVVRRLSRFFEKKERENVTDRASDLVANDPHAASVIDSMAVNIAGTGLIPQSAPHEEILGWTEEQVRDFQIQAEWAFSQWARRCDVSGKLPFWGLQFTTIYSLLMNGEYIRIPVVEKDPARRFSLAIQAVHPQRMYTPSDLRSDPSIRDGIRLRENGAPKSYFIESPKNPFKSISHSNLSSSDFSEIRARIGHRPGIFHGFIPKSDEQLRGVSILAPAMKFFKDLNDYLDFELVGAIVASSFPIFVETNNPYGGVPGQDATTGERYKEINPGQVMYGRANEKPHVLSTNRPGNTFPVFVERILRAVGASVGMPYEIISKDFSKTNYSSARAALLEAWRVFSFYQKWLVDDFCQPVWEMVLEEAWLRGMITLPKGSPDFYEIAPELSRAVWIPPKRGHVDPTKEIEAIVTALENNLTTLAESNVETGGDWETRIRQRGRERRMEEKEGVIPKGLTYRPGARAADNTPPAQQGSQQ